METAIVTDSTCDIPADLATKLDIHVVPNIIVMQGKSVEDGVGISRREFYERLPEMDPLPTTSTASSGTYQTLYDQLFKQDIDQIISIHASSQLSGIYNAASVAANSFGNRVAVVDSQNVSLGLGFQVLEAAQAALEGKPLESILADIALVRQRVRLVAMLDTLEYVRRSGRVSWVRARVGSLLRIKPFIEIVEGDAKSVGDARTRRQGIARLREIVLSLGPLERLAIMHSNAEADAQLFLASLDADPPYEPLVVNATTVIGTHVGPNGLAFTAVVK
ncbi:MAG: DegV family protein [Anaerolineales bacterium]|nr:DegV family protein [Anaerolineales bacterium]